MILIHKIEKLPHPPSIQSGTIDVLKICLHGQGVLGIHIFMVGADNWDTRHENMNNKGPSQVAEGHQPSALLRRRGVQHPQHLFFQLRSSRK